MSIQNELSSDIAVALLTQKNTDPKRLNDLKETVLKIHSILQSTAGSRSKRAAAEDSRRARVTEPFRSEKSKPE